jgi:signal peptidase II
VGSVRFWTFNVADMGVTVGAACLVLALWQADGVNANANADSRRTDPRA